MIAIGTRVALRRQFLRDTGQHTGPWPAARGTVIEIFDTPLFRIEWDAGIGRVTSYVNKANLVREDKIHLEES